MIAQNRPEKDAVSLNKKTVPLKFCRTNRYSSPSSYLYIIVCLFDFEALINCTSFAGVLFGLVLFFFSPVKIVLK